MGLCRGRSRLAVRGLRERHSMVVDGQLQSERKAVVVGRKSTDYLVDVELQHSTNIIT